jgi:hypothetical protein
VSEPSPRQVLYALVAGGFVIVVAILVIGSAVVGLSPGWWTITMSVVLVVATVWSGLNWERTGPVLLISIGLLILWTVGTLLIA